MKVIHTDQAPAAVGPYSQAIEANGVLYCSGQIAINPAEGKIVAKTIEEQAEQCCRNVEAVLKEAWHGHGPRRQDDVLPSGDRGFQGIQ